MPGNYEDNIFFIGDFDDNLENQVITPFIKAIEEQSDKNNGRIDLHINSTGGYLHLCMHFVELVEIAKANGVTVRTIVPNMAYSAGSMLAITGTPGERYIGKAAEHLVHYGQIVSFETTPEQIKRFTGWKNRTFANNLKHYQEYCDIPELDKKMLDEGFFVPAKQAIKWGLADKYMINLPLEN